MKRKTINIELFDDRQKEFLRHKKLQGVSNTTLPNYHKIFNNLLYRLGEPLEYENQTRLEEQIGRYFLSIQHLNGGYNSYRVNINCFFNWLEKKGYVKKNPIHSLEIPKRKDLAKPRPATIEEVKAIIEIIDIKSFSGFRDYVFILLTIDCGIRPIESSKLTWDLINKEQRTLTITPEIGKCEKGRVLPLSNMVLDNLKKLRKICESFDTAVENVFLKEDGTKSTTTTFQRRIAKYSLKANLDRRITPYQLRHYFATQYLKNNGNLIYLQYLMGHSDIQMTKKYVGIDQEAIGKEHGECTPLGNIVKRNTRIRKLFK